MTYKSVLGLIGLAGLVVACTPSTEGTDTPTAINASSLEHLNTLVTEASGTDQPLGGLELRLVDAPLDVDAVNVTICGVKVKARVAGEEEKVEENEAESERDGQENEHVDEDENHDEDKSGSSWIKLGDECVSVDLLSLQDGVFESLGLAALPPGDYGQLRLRVSESSVTVGGVEHELKVPSGAQSGLKIVGGFTLEDGAITTLTLDFDAERSVHKRGDGDYLMRPVIFLADSERHQAQARMAEHRMQREAPEDAPTMERPERENTREDMRQDLGTERRGTRPESTNN